VYEIKEDDYFFSRPLFLKIIIVVVMLHCNAAGVFVDDGDCDFHGVVGE
jgi:hypothetical protein